MLKVNANGYADRASPWTTRPTTGQTAGKQRDRMPPIRAGELLGEVVYAVRLSDGSVKIGWTHNLGRRKQHFGAGTEVLGFRSGDRAAENALHASLKDCRVRGREYYHPTAEVLAVVNDMRNDLGLPPLTA